MINEVKAGQGMRHRVRLRVILVQVALIPRKEVPDQTGGVQSQLAHTLQECPFLLLRACRLGSVQKCVALHLVSVRPCFLLESVTFFTSPGLFTQTSCSLTTRIAFSAILLTAQMSAVSLGVWCHRIPLGLASRASQEEC
jgi:hypothetical protein